jgi:hypothetical protein
VKNSFYTLFLSFFLFGLSQPAKGSDTLHYSRKEYWEIKPVPYDLTTYKKFKKDETYNYYQVAVEKKSIINRILDSFYRWFIRNINKNIGRKEFDRVMWIVGVIIFIVIGVILYIVKPSIFYFNKKNKLLYSIEYEDIYELDFKRLIQNALGREEYREVIRWIYLSTLKALHENDRISWDSNKTVNEYVYEIKNQELRKNFKKLSEVFAYYRYGNGEVNEKRYRNFESLSEQIIRQMK